MSKPQLIRTNIHPLEDLAACEQATINSNKHTPTRNTQSKTYTRVTETETPATTTNFGDSGSRGKNPKENKPPEYSIHFFF